MLAPIARTIWFWLLVAATITQLFIAVYVFNHYDITPRVHDYGPVHPLKLSMENATGVRSLRRTGSLPLGAVSVGARRPQSFGNGTRRMTEVAGENATSAKFLTRRVSTPARAVGVRRHHAHRPENIIRQELTHRSVNISASIKSRAVRVLPAARDSNGRTSRVKPIEHEARKSSRIVPAKSMTPLHANFTNVNRSRVPLFVRPRHPKLKTSSMKNATSSKARKRNGSNVSNLSSEDVIVSKVHVLMQKTPLRSRSEVLRIHHPLVIGNLQRAPSNSTLSRELRCTDFSKSVIVSAKACLELLTPKGDEHVDSSLAKVAARASSRSINRTTCNKGSALIVPINWRDRSVCHLLQKFLFGFTVFKRAVFSPEWLDIPPVETVIVLISPQLESIFVDPKSFHSGLLEALFVQHGVSVVFRRGLGKLEAKYRCFAAGVFIGSYANRFAYSDAELGPNSSYYGLSPLPFPLASDALVLRAHVFKERRVPKKRFKVLYVARRTGWQHTWTQKSEPEVRSMLRQVAWQNGAQFSVFEGDTGKGFAEQIRYFVDAAIIIGFHGAGLALGVFAPRGAKLIEIEPEYHSMNIFGHLRSSGLSYEVVRLSKGSSNGSLHSSELIRHDKRVIESVLERSLQDVLKLG